MSTNRGLSKCALVLGAGGAVGKNLINRLLCETDFSLVLIYRNNEEFVHLNNTLVKNYACDLNNLDAVDAICQQNLAVNHIFDCSGKINNTRFQKKSFADIIDEVNSNFLAFLKIINFYIPMMVANKFGKILYFGSSSSYRSSPDLMMYSSLKLSIKHLCLSTHNNLSRDNVKFIVLVCPPIKSKMNLNGNGVPPSKVAVKCISLITRNSHGVLFLNFKTFIRCVAYFFIPSFVMHILKKKKNES